MLKALLCAVAATSLWSAPARAQNIDEKAAIVAQQEAMAPLGWMDGTWRGEASTQTPSGELRIIQTERIGPFLDRSVKVINGRGYDPESGEIVFDALGVISFDPESNSYSITSWAQGRHGVFPLEVTENGYRWSIENGPATITYVAQFDGEKFVESGTVSLPGQPDRPFFNMVLERVVVASWPEAGGVPMTR